MGSFMRFVQALFRQTWSPRVAALVSVMSFAVGVIGWLLSWHYFPRFLYWGVIWAILALGARFMNRYDPL